MHELTRWQRGSVAALFSATLVCSIPATHAATATWTGGGGADRNWTTAANWGGTAPLANDSLVFDGTTGLTPSNNFAANTQFNGLTFNAGAGAFTLSGAAIKLGGNIVMNAAVNETVILTLALQQDTDIAVNSANNITFGQGISGAFALTKSGTGAGVAVLSAAGTYTGGTTVNAGILRSTPNSNGNVFGSGNITIASGAQLQFRALGTNIVTTANIISGAGTVYVFGQASTSVQILSGANSYSGATTLDTGVLNIQNATALGSTANGTSVTAGAALQIQNNITVGAEALALNGTGIATDGALRNISGTNVWQGTVTLGSAARINSDAGSLTFNTAANSITGTQNLTLGGAGNGTVGGTITTGSGTLTKDGAGTWTLSGANTYSGGTTVSVGTLLISSSTGSGSGSGIMAVSSGATVGGTGTISGATTISGIASPGDSGTIGQLHFGNGVTWNGGASSGAATDWVFQLGAGNTSDNLSITGNFVKGSGSAFQFDFGGSSATGTFDLVDWTGSATGFSVSDFTYVNLGAGNAGTFQLNGNQLAFVTPEPATWALLAFSLAIVVAFRRRHRAI